MRERTADDALQPVRNPRHACRRLAGRVAATVRDSRPMTRRIAATVLLALTLGGCGSDKQDRTDDLTYCVSAIVLERTTGSTMPGHPCDPRR